MRIGRGHVLTLVAGGCLALGASAAGAGGASVLKCGATLTKSTKLTAGSSPLAPERGSWIGA